MTTTPTTAIVRPWPGLHTQKVQAQQNPGEKRPTPPEYLGAHQIQAILSAAPNPRARLLMLLQWRAGLRVSEALLPEAVGLKAYANATDARREVGAHFRFYNDQRPHQALGYRTTDEVFHGAMNAPGEESKERRNSPELVLVSLPGATPRAPGLSLDSP